MHHLSTHAPSILSYLLIYIPKKFARLTNDHLAVLREVIHRNLEVERCGTLSYAAGDVVVRTVARAEPTTKVTSFADGDTSQVSADT
jgi:hypothetical protein